MKTDMSRAEQMNEWKDVRQFAVEKTKEVKDAAAEEVDAIWKAAYLIWSRKTESVRTSKNLSKAQRAEEKHKQWVAKYDAKREQLFAKLEAKQQAEWDKRENAVNHSPEVTDEDLNKWD